uniref:Nuclear RNA export factor 3 n=1 Tax=Loxodonta africana TaxID=9785 RepID=G3UHJ2_LOXAF
IHLSLLQEQDRDVAMSGAQCGPWSQMYPHSTPYAIPYYYRGGSCHRGDQTHGNMERDRKPPQEGTQGNRQDGSSRSWFKVTIPFGIKYDEKWLLGLIQSQCSVPFNPIEFHYENMQAQFFVENASIAFELKKVSGKIWDEENESISIFVSPCAVPPSVQKELKSETVKLPNTKGMKSPNQALVLRRVHSDPNVMTHNIEIGPNLRNCMAASLQIHEDNRPKILSFNSSNNIPYRVVGLPDTMQKAPKFKSLNLSKNEVKSEGELDKVKGLEPEEMIADKNPLCTTFPDKSTNISSILELFPKLLCLDNQEGPPPIVFGTEASKKLPVYKGSILGSETLGNLILLFLHQYYCVYDYGYRHLLLDAYYYEACFSLAIPLNLMTSPRNSLDKYSKGSRNMRKLKDPILWVQLLKHTKRDIVDFLSVLPRTQHDVSSLVVDMCVQMEKMLCFSVSGAFKEALEVEGMSLAHVRAFTQIFIATPSSNFSLCIVNDQLCVRDSSPIETQGAFSTPVPTSSSFLPTLSQEQQEMVPAFTAQSGLNLEWAQKCLHSNNWNYTRASQIFALSTPVLKIPEDTFMK